MADETKPGESKPAKPTATEHARLEQVALTIFNRLGANLPSNRDSGGLAIESFRRAKAFLAVSEGVKGGDISAEPTQPDKPEYVEIPVWQQTADEKWAAVKDPITGKPVVQMAPVDPYAYAPNLDASHPINQRFKPRDGRSFAERQKSFKESREVEATFRAARDAAPALN